MQERGRLPFHALEHVHAVLPRDVVGQELPVPQPDRVQDHHVDEIRRAGPPHRDDLVLGLHELPARAVAHRVEAHVVPENAARQQVTRSVAAAFEPVALQRPAGVAPVEMGPDALEFGDLGLRRLRDGLVVGEGVGVTFDRQALLLLLDVLRKFLVIGFRFLVLGGRRTARAHGEDQGA